MTQTRALKLWRHLFVFFVLHGTVVSYAAAPQTIFQTARDHVVALEIRDKAGSRLAAYSAIAVDETHLVTNCNPLYGAVSLVVVRSDGIEISVSRGAVDSTRNLCLIETTGPVGRAVRMRGEPPAEGERIYALTNALGLGISITEGVLSGIRTQHGETYIQFTAPIAPGAEGGALLDAEGQLVGVIDYERRDGQNVNFALPANWIKEIGGRAETQREHLAALETAYALSKEKDWPAVARHAESWVKAHPGEPRSAQTQTG